MIDLSMFCLVYALIAAGTYLLIVKFGGGYYIYAPRKTVIASVCWPLLAAAAILSALLCAVYAGLGWMER